jgi:fluoroquinolone transport system permease protein
MRALEMMRNQASTDAKLVARDRFLTGMAALVVALAVILRFGLPFITDSLREIQGFDLAPYFVLVSSFVTLSIAAPLIGIVIGFILLETRENRTLQALMVSPISLQTYLFYRVSIPILLGAVLTPLVAIIVGVGLPSPSALIAISLVGSTVGGIATLFIATFSDNKVQAFAMMKFFSAAGLIPFAAFFIREPWQYVAGIYPPYWAFKAYWVAGDGGAGWWIYLLIACVTLLATLWAMSWRFQTLAYRG